MSLLRARGVSVRFGDFAAVSGVDVAAGAGALVGLIGPNGAGKTSLLRALAGLVPCEGVVELEGQPIDRIGRRRFARTVSYLAQAQPVHWPFAVRDLIALGRLPHRAPFQGLSAEDHRAVAEAMAAAAVTDLAERAVDTLSGGERARVLLARALAVQAPILLVDEPIAALDPYHQIEIMELLRGYAEAGALVVAVLHDLMLAERFCHRLLLLRQGKLLADGAPGEVLVDENVRAAYHVTVIHAGHEGRRITVPWERVEEP
ncbi:MAG: ATP-binding cassette domain-containing protein [Alphaproteobacteria bacterium]|nr:ATP-binding cassette domain-containing protein [Alphaproteobacteria bacterium]